MKKRGEINLKNLILIVFLAILLVSNLLTWVYYSKLKQSYLILEEELQKEKRVYFIEKQREGVKVSDTDNFCRDICSKRLYDGYGGSELVYEGAYFDYECECYMTVR